MLTAFRPIEGYHDIDTHLGIVLSLDRKYIFRKKKNTSFVSPGEHAAIVWVTDVAEDDAENV